jgi:putative DNA primase/helicase
MTANEALAAANEAAKTRGDAMREAKQFLRDLLEEGPVAAADAAEKAAAEGINSKTLNRARKTLGVIAEKDGFQGPWKWRLP